MDTNWAIRLGVLCVTASLSALFSGAETAMFSLRPEELKVGDKKKGQIARSFIHDLLEHPGHLLTTIVFANMVVNLLFFSVSYVLIMNFRPYLPAYVPPLLGVGVLLFVIFACEVIPKNLAVVYARPVSTITAVPLFFLQKLLRPILIPLEHLNTALAGFFTRVLPEQPQLSDDELQILVELSEKEGVIEEDIGEIIAEVLELSDIAVKEILIPRVDMTCLRIDWPAEKIATLFKQSKHTLLPVYEGSMDNMLGVIHMRDFFFRDSEAEIKNLIRKIPFIPESASAENALHSMRMQQTRMVFVVDEYGAVEGFLALEDIIEEVVGSIRDEFDAAEPIPVQKLDDSRYRLRGDLSIREWKDVFSPDFELEMPSDTIGGLVMTLLEKIPQAGDTVTYKNMMFEVESIQGRRVKYVQLRLLPRPDNE